MPNYRPKNKARTKQFQIRVTSREHKNIIKAARLAELSLSEYGRSHIPELRNEI
jgi:predicted HicB family RNase H-like nuclease